MELLITQSLAVWYLSYALTRTHGIFGVFVKLRQFDTRIGLNLLACIVCTSAWVAGLMLLLWSVVPIVVQLFAIAGLAMLAHKFTGWDYGG